jgi:hypothetical protein
MRNPLNVLPPLLLLEETTPENSAAALLIHAETVKGNDGRSDDADPAST